jgi:hypothetical protein
LGVQFNKNSNSNEEVNNRLNKSKNIIRSLNSILWNKSLSKITKKIYKIVIQSIMIHGAEVWDVSRKNRNKLLATKINCQQRSFRRMILDRIQNKVVREMMELEKT